MTERRKTFVEELACRGVSLNHRKSQQQRSVRARRDKGDLFCIKNCTKQFKRSFNPCETPEIMFSCLHFSYEKKSRVTYPRVWCQLLMEGLGLRASLTPAPVFVLQEDPLDGGCEGTALAHIRVGSWRRARPLV